jgi:hypothetical protein
VASCVACVPEGVDAGAQESASLERLDAAAHGDRQGRDAPHAGLQALRALLKGSTQARRQARKDGRFHPRLWHGERPLPEFLGEYASAGCRLEIISPFFSDLEETPTLRALIEALAPTAVRVLLPRGDDGTAKCSQVFYEAVQVLPNVKWGKLPRRFTAFGKGEAASKQRYVHAKVYRVFSPSERTELMRCSCEPSGSRT